MPRYLVQAAYTAEAMAAFVGNPQDRVAGVRALVERLGGHLDSFDFSLGDYDVAIIYTAPDAIAAAAISMAATSAGHLKAFKTTALLSPEEFMEAQRKAHGLNYQAPARA